MEQRRVGQGGCGDWVKGVTVRGKVRARNWGRVGMGGMPSQYRLKAMSMPIGGVREAAVART